MTLRTNENRWLFTIVGPFLGSIIINRLSEEPITIIPNKFTATGKQSSMLASAARLWSYWCPLRTNENRSLFTIVNRSILGAIMINRLSDEPITINPNKFTATGKQSSMLASAARLWSYWCPLRTNENRSLFTIVNRSILGAIMINRLSDEPITIIPNKFTATGKQSSMLASAARLWSYWCPLRTNENWSLFTIVNWSILGAIMINRSASIQQKNSQSQVNSPCVLASSARLWYCWWPLRIKQLRIDRCFLARLLLSAHASRQVHSYRGTVLRRVINNDLEPMGIADRLCTNFEMRDYHKSIIQLID